jgi:hypothetical protein
MRCLAVLPIDSIWPWALLRMLIERYQRPLLLGFARFWSLTGPGDSLGIEVIEWPRIVILNRFVKERSLGRHCQLPAGWPREAQECAEIIKYVDDKYEQGCWWMLL